MNVRLMCLEYRSRSRSWTISIGSLPCEIGLGPAGLGVDGVDPQVGRDVAIEQIELKVNQDRLLAGHLETEPVEPRLTFVGVVEIIDVVGGAIDVAAEPQLVGLLPRVVGLGLDRRAVRVGECQIASTRRGLERGIAPALRLLASIRLAWPSRAGPIGEIEVRIARVQLLGEPVCSGPCQLDREPVIGLDAAALEGDREAVGLAGLEVAEREGFSMAGFHRQRPRRRVRGRLVVRAGVSGALGLRARRARPRPPRPPMRPRLVAVARRSLTLSVLPWVGSSSESPILIVLDWRSYRNLGQLGGIDPVAA